MNEYEINNQLPFNIHDGSVRNLTWIDDNLSFSIEGCYVNGTLQWVNLCFEGVTWIRSLCIDEPIGYIEGTPYENYPLLDRDKLNENYAEYVYRGYLDDITVIDNIAFVNQVMFFDFKTVKIF